MLGGSASSGGRWSLGAKTYRAPTEQERAREAQDRWGREAERRKIEELKHERRHIRKTRVLQREVAIANDRALGTELGARTPLLGRGRSASFSSFGSPGLHSLGSPIGGGYAVERERERLELDRRAAADRMRREEDLQRVRAQRIALEAESARRQRTASTMRNERDLLAAANAQILSSPRLSFSGGSPLLGGSPGLGHRGAYLGVPETAGLRRSRSFSSALPRLGTGASPHLMGPRFSPRMSPGVLQGSPRLGGMGPGMGMGRGMGMGIGIGRPPSPLVHVSPRMERAATHSPQIVNYNTYNVSPRVGAVDGLGYPAHHHGGDGGLGALDDLNLGGLGARGGIGGRGLHQHGSPMVDPLAYGEYEGYRGNEGYGAAGGGLFGGGGGGGMPGMYQGGGEGMPGSYGAGAGMGIQRDFVVTDLDSEPGRAV
ncbi:hypothetical protein JCM1841_001131, partial [Sporobolomyces salmonicolor]